MMTKFNLNTIYHWPLKKQIILLGVIFVVVFFIGYSWMVSGVQNKIVAAQKEETELKFQMDSIFKNETNHKIELAEFPAYQNKLQMWKGKLVDRSQVSELIKQILKIGATNNVYFSLFNPAPEEKDGTYSRIPINIVMVSSYHHLAEFISQLANMQNIVIIRKFVISNENKSDEIGSVLADKAASENLVTTKMRIELYLMPEKTEHAK